MIRLGDPPKPGIAYQRRRGAYAILPQGDSFLLTHQGGQFDEFQLPGGGVDPGESPLEALHREVLEETGWRIAQPRRIGIFRRFTWMPDYDIWAEKICEIFVAQPVRALGPAHEPDHEAVWMAQDTAIKRLANAGDRHFAARYMFEGF
ncbi:NUDIX hydrolase [Rhodalgimonas zhirmunskyi]|uniref:NUDIX hydrolase n=1 Tax=Rhodalgimonas zhirmunskyi TaxID=2964767 RepID=A0AAJ1UDS0_9RHOB|nr:NUDIX hydrolase [Rhodoalgimonas zhirmunskyi]MDQ2094232.1 NUDIX hydrolase [Rhodoalgimonas zhirmunskyi]